MLKPAKPFRVVLTIILSVLIMLFIYIYLRVEIRNSYETKGRELETVAILKVDQIAAWIRDEMSDAQTIADNRILIYRMETCLENPTDMNRKRVGEILSGIMLQHNYSHVLISDTEGDFLLSSDGDDFTLSPYLKEQIKMSLENRSVLFTDLYQCQVHDEIHIDFIAPFIGRDERLIGAIVFQFDPTEFLFPLIRSWPTLSRSSESLLYKVKGDSILFLSELKHRPNAALNYSVPMSETNLVAAKAVLQTEEGLMEGLDYAGNKVLGYVMAVPGTDWVLVSKTDKKELFSELYLHIIIVILLAVFLLLFLAAGFAYLSNARQKAIYRELYRQQKNYQITLNSIGDAVISTNREGMIEYLNPVAEKITGWTHGEALGKRIEKVFRIINEETRATVESPVEKVLREGTVVGLSNHTLLISKEGREIPVADSGAPIQSEKGETIGVVLVFRDQSEERQYQEILTRRETQYRELVESTDAIAWEYDIDLDQWVYVAPQVTDKLGWQPEEWTNLAFWKDNIHPDEREDAANYCLTCTAKGEAHSLEYRFRSKSGGYVWLRDVVSVESKENRPVTLRGVMFDITERKNMEIALVNAKERAEESERLKMAFLTNMSHEIRTPLNGILGFTNLLAERDSLSKESRQEYSKIINKSAEGLLKIINDILDISRLETSKTTIEKKEFDIANTLSTIYSVFEKRIDDSGGEQVELIVKMPEVPVVLNTDENRLIQIFSNLLDNALRFTSEGSVTFGIAAVRENMAEFFVEDTGIGIPLENQKIVFDRFSQANNHAKRSYGGTGLGLTIVKKLLEMMGSGITLESEPGKGTCFRFHLPCTPGVSTEKPDIREGSVSTNLGSARILIVEDDPVSRLFFERALSNTSAELFFAETGKEAIDLFQSGTPDIILMDINLPDISGLEVVRRIREKNAEVAIIAQTAYALAEDQQHAMESGCNDFITKPINLSLLFQKLRKFSG
jgi:PAS domain S-box-containing protein